jgi:hypothetical protein
MYPKKPRFNSKYSTKRSQRQITPKLNPDKECKVTVQILDVKLGDSDVHLPQVTTIYNDKKINLKVPLKKPLAYEFATINDPMVFKYALTNSNDLLGFLYLEIPPKFRVIKSFEIDDWFPIKAV